MRNEQESPENTLEHIPVRLEGFDANTDLAQPFAVAFLEETREIVVYTHANIEYHHSIRRRMLSLYADKNPVDSGGGGAVYNPLQKYLTIYNGSRSLDGVDREIMKRVAKELKKFFSAEVVEIHEVRGPKIP